MGRLLYAVAASAALCAPATAQAAEPRAVVQGEMDPELRAIVTQVIGDTDRPIENRFEARRRARAAAEDAIAALRSEGYYAYRVDPDVSEADPPRPLVQIAPGPRFLLGEATLAWTGKPPNGDAQAAAVRALSLPPGGPGRAADIIAAEGRVVAAVQKRGYADAVAYPRDVVVDHADKTVTPTYNIAAGLLVHLEGLDIAPGSRTNPLWVRHLAPWAAGDPYDPDDVAELERRLLDTGVYDSVTVALAPVDQTSASGLRPVVVALAERKPRTIEGGASYSTSEGAGVNVRWTHYNLLSRADTIALYGQVSIRDSRTGVDLTLPQWLRPQQTLKTGAAVYRVVTDAYKETGVGVHADVTRRYGHSAYLTSYVTVGASVDGSRTDEIKAGTLTSLGRNLITVKALGDLLLDRSNDPLSPTSGWRLSARLEPTVIVGDTNLPYLRAVAQGTYYQPLDKTGHTVIAGRLRLGRILNGTVDQIPASQRFYAGGGGSVRGFPFQAVGPRLADSTPQGGVFLAESSVEVRRDITEKWSAAVFVDAGAVGSGGPVDFNTLAAGAGFGVRYNLGIVPIRIDFATPVVRRRGEPLLQAYVSIGQSF
ncbi:autotransporter assembly complex family protein [Phenylobacterium sp.]|uniref:autotransporter assembly complex protein TamA n=1 Tax=Phenylobacterium sp. TaxID=1871053 RepID=UPI0025F1ED33|nr:autotransporter assembly complex family protein [Phenylobacterium sp.]